MKNQELSRIEIRELRQNCDSKVSISGWIQNRRDAKGLIFVVVRDGSGFCQCVISEETVGETMFTEAKKLTLETSLTIRGTVKEDARQIGGYEIQVDSLAIMQIAEDYPISNKEHGVDFLMDNRHLWLRSKRQWAIMRIRNQVIYSIHNFFQSRGYVEMDAPIFTGNACEGTSNLFETNFFDEPAYLSQSGQLYGEAMAMAMGKIYTFGPTFRAEKSKTRRHLSEFWMIEPEMAFYNLAMTMDVIEDFINAILKDVLEKCAFELEQIGRDVEVLKNAMGHFPRLTYDEAVEILKGKREVNGENSIDMLRKDLEAVKQNIETTKAEIAQKELELSNPNLGKNKINHFKQRHSELKNELKELEEQERNIPQWISSAEGFEYGNDLGGSDETVITRLFNTPVMVYNWPKVIKAFYMKEDENNATLVKGVDVLAPEGYGEIVGGGERETDINVLIEAIAHHDLSLDAFQWYLDLRRYGSVPHAGFGLGLERLVSWICKISHVRETIPFPRLIGRILP